MNRLVTLVVGLALLWALFNFGARAKAPEIEADIQDRSQAALSEQGYGDVAASADGRDVTLTGTVASDADRGSAESVASNVYGVRVVHNEATVVAPYTTKFCKDSTHIRLAGGRTTGGRSACIPGTCARHVQVLDRRGRLHDPHRFARRFPEIHGPGADRAGPA